MLCKDKACDACDTVTSSIPTVAAPVVGHVFIYTFSLINPNALCMTFSSLCSHIPSGFFFTRLLLYGSLASGLMFAIMDSNLPVLSV